MFKKILAVVLALCAAAAFAAVDVNNASQADLETIKGIGPAISAKIVDARKQGSFKDWQDMITRVKGVGKHNAATFSSEGLTVNGAAFSGAPASMAKKETKAESKSKSKAPTTATAPTTTTAATATTAAPATAGKTAAAPMTAAEKKAAATTAKEQKKTEKKAAADAAKKAKAEKKAEKKSARSGAVAASAPAK